MIKTEFMKAQKQTAIPIVKNNEGQNIFVSHTCFDELKKMYKDGYFSALITGLDKQPHVVLMDDNAEKFES